MEKPKQAFLCSLTAKNDFIFLYGHFSLIGITKIVVQKYSSLKSGSLNPFEKMSENIVAFQLPLNIALIMDLLWTKESIKQTHRAL